MLARITLLLLLQIPFYVFSDVIHLRKAPESPIGQYIKEALVTAYSSLGHSIRWFDMEGTTELELTAKGRLSAALARVPLIENEFPQLIRVPFPLLHFKLLKVADKSLCGQCLEDDIRSVSYTRGSRISEEHIERLDTKVARFPIEQGVKLSDMLIKKRVEAIYLMDFELNSTLLNNDDYMIETVHEEFDYHYLSPENEFLKESLFQALNDLENDGTLKKIRRKYHIENSLSGPE